MIEIPKGTWGENCAEDTPGPCWLESVDRDGNRLKPIIKCQCGLLCGIGLHHVHTDGTVTASFYHMKGDKPPADPHGCGWHVFLKLKDYALGDFPPERS